MNVIVICGDHKRNNCIIEYLKKIKYVNILKIFLLNRDNIIPSTPDQLNSNLKKLWNLHFEKREEAENKRFKFVLHENIEEKKIINIKNLNEILKYQKDINNINGTQEVFDHRAKMCTLAAKGKWSENLENSQ